MTGVRLFTDVTVTGLHLLIMAYHDSKAVSVLLMEHVRRCGRAGPGRCTVHRCPFRQRRV